MKLLIAIAVSAITGLILGLLLYPLLFDTNVEASQIVNENCPAQIHTAAVADPQVSIKNRLTNKFNIETKALDKPSERVARILVENASSKEISEALDAFFQDDDLQNYIDDERQFASRLMDELYKDDSPLIESSQLKLFFSTQSESQENHNQQVFQLEGRETLYAHFDTQNGAGTGDNRIFIKWKNLDTGEILLFQEKRIRADSNTNWVSFEPDDPWKAGSYEVSIYQFTSELGKLASEFYYIQQKS